MSDHGLEQVDGVKVFTATRAQERAALGDHITRWLQSDPDIEIQSYTVRQSSDSAYHCLSLTFFYRRAD